MQILNLRSEAIGMSPQQILNNLVKTWVGIALIGQWLFALYIIVLYALPTLFGNTELTLSLMLGKGVSGESKTDTFVFFTHIVPASLMALSGLLQLFPSVRRSYPTFHRYNGRMFFILGLSGAITGMYLSFSNHPSIFEIGALGVRINGLLIPVAIGFAWYFAVNKNFKAHQRFAIHSFLLINGVWTFRLYLFGWYMLNQGPNGNTDTLDGPADIAISFACYFAPMVIAEMIFWAQRQRNNRIVWWAASLTCVGIVTTFIGIIAASMFNWIPTITGVIQALL